MHYIKFIQDNKCFLAHFTPPETECQPRARDLILICVSDGARLYISGNIEVHDIDMYSPNCKDVLVDNEF
jgi:hypothetical protein